MKILLFIDSLGSGGAQRQLVGLAVLLQNKGYDIVVCTYHKYDFYKSYLDENHITYHNITGAANKYKRVYYIYKYFKSINPDWVIAYQETPSLLACLSKLLGRRFNLIVSERNTTQKVGWNERIRFQLYRLSNYIVPNSYSQSSYLRQRYRWMQKKIQTISNFVDLERFHYVNHKRSFVPEIMIAASLWESKNPQGLLTALKILKDKQVKVHFTWYGLNENVTDGQKAILNSVSEKNLSDYIVFLPKTKTIELEYQKADYLCLPSFYEGTPNVICEAIASGLPVACSDVCDNSRYVAEGKNGFLFDPRNAESIADAVRRLLSLSNEEYSSFSINSRQIAEKLLSKERFVQSYIELIENR